MSVETVAEYDVVLSFGSRSIVSVVLVLFWCLLRRGVEDAFVMLITADGEGWVAIRAVPLEAEL